MFAIGFDRVGVEYLKHLLRQIGEVIDAQTLPETVSELAMMGADAADASVIAELRKEVESLRIEIKSAAHMAEMSKRLDSMQQQIEAMDRSTADVSELRKSLDSAAIDAAFVAPGADWEHPGAIGASKAASGKFTTLDASGAVTLSPANANVALSPTGTGLVTITPAAVGSMNNVAIGATAHKSGKFTQLTATDLISNSAAFAGAPSATFTNTTASGYSLIQAIGGASGGGQMEFYRGATPAGGVYGDSTGVVLYRSTAAILDMTITTAGVKVLSGFGCNGKTAQAAVASGGTLAGVISALVANGILSS
jgi:hypothetical protein